jgi:hypothetical protein
MSDQWVRSAFENALLVVDNGELVRAAGEHVMAEGEWTDGKIRPSLMAVECQLQRTKKFRGHLPQPGARWMAARQGKPSANSNITFLRGFMGEGMVVAALKKYAEMLGEYEVIGCAPTFVAEAEPDWQAHPDIIVLRQGILENIQVKCPSVFAFNRYEKGEMDTIRSRYMPQVAAEMHILRLMGIPVERSHIFLITWEGWPPGTEGAEEVRCLDVPVMWEHGMDVWAERVAQDIRADDRNADNGIFPSPLARDNWNKWPCSYCMYARIQQHDGQVTCEEHERWEILATPSSEALPPAPPKGNILRLPPPPAEAKESIVPALLPPRKRSSGRGPRSGSTS